MKKKKIHKKSNNGSEHRYHGPLVTSGVHWSYIKLLSWLSGFLSVGLYWGTTFIDPVGHFNLLFLSCSYVSGFLIVYSITNFLLSRFQTFSYLLLAVNSLILLIDFGFFGTVLLVGNEYIYSLLSLVFMLIVTVVTIISTAVYSWYYLPKNQGKVWSFNQVGKNKSKYSQFIVVFTCVLLAPVVITGYIKNIFGIILSLSLAIIFPAVIVDAIYAAYYVRKHPDSEELF